MPPGDFAMAAASRRGVGDAAPYNSVGAGLCSARGTLQWLQRPRRGGGTPPYMQ